MLILDYYIWTYAIISIIGLRKPYSEPYDDKL